MGSNLKQEAMERVGEVEHHECYYDTDRNKPLADRAASPGVDRNSVPSRDAIAGAVARGWCTPENANKTMDEALAWAIVDELKALLGAPQPVAAAQATSMDSCNLLDYSAHIAQRKAAGLQPMGLAEFASVVTENARTAAQAAPEMSYSQLTELARKACADGRLNWAGFRIDSDDRYTIPVISTMEYNLVLLALATAPAAQPTDTTKGA